MQAELKADHPDLDIVLFGINEEGHEADAHVMAEGNTIGLVQDTTTVDATAAWGAAYRDVIILDGDNHIVAAFNLTTHDLSVPANYAALRDLLTTTAAAR